VNRAVHPARNFKGLTTQSSSLGVIPLGVEIHPDAVKKNRRFLVEGAVAGLTSLQRGPYTKAL
jgi:hypothetical protein